MLKTRILSAIAGIIILIIFIYWGAFPFYIFISLLTIIAINEYKNMLPEGFKNNKYFLAFMSLSLLLYTYLNSRGLMDFSPGIIIIFLLILLFVYHMLEHRYNNILQSIGYDLFGILYIGGGMSFFILLRNFNYDPFSGVKALWFVLIATWATDTGAYFSGKYLGKKQLAPIISPNKTIEGAIGGIIFTVIIVMIMGFYFGMNGFNWFVYAIIVAIIAITGDLFESAIKRDMGVKDSGKIIPGHGGILDRFDSLFFTLAFTYYYLINFL